MSTEFWMGVLTVPGAAIVIVGLLWVGVQVQDAWTTWKPKRIADKEKRATLAVSMAVAHRLLQVRLPGGYVFAYRARVNSWFGDYKRAVAVVHDALDEAMEKGRR